MTATTIKRGTKAPRHKPVPQRRAVDTVALPVSARALRRNVAIAATTLAAFAGVVVVSLMGIPQRMWADFVRSTATAGFEIRHVEVDGTREMPRMPVYDAALSGSSNAMLTADLPAIRTRLLALPWVADASVGRRLPDTISISIVERRPVALWQNHQHFALIDISGQVLPTQRIDRFAGLPVVVGAGANKRVRELLVLTASAPTLSDKVDAAVLVGGRRWDVKFKSGETLALPDTPAAATAAFKRFARLESELGEDRKLLGGRFQRFDMRLPGQMTVGGPAVQQALEAAAKAAKAAQKPTTI
ncbi:MAG: FtsQ-type POTRA domain-containing protein [Sandarakinorhabdus sp.]|nr:FtsQ-type POTRA domain-containing protein [Sandarakinorhabdus sp.]